MAQQSPPCSCRVIAALGTGGCIHAFLPVVNARPIQTKRRAIREPPSQCMRSGEIFMKKTASMASGRASTNACALKIIST